jgi:hypothetical protein
MAEKVGISPMTLHRIETGMVRLSLRRPNLSSPLPAWPFIKFGIRNAEFGIENQNFFILHSAILVPHCFNLGGFLFDFIDGGVEFREFLLQILWKVDLEVENLFPEKG